MAKNSCVSIIAFALALVGLISNVVSIGSSSWLVSVKYLKMTIGVFRHCDLDNGYCGGMSDIAAIVDAQEVGWFRAVQALFLLACLGSLLTCVLIGLVLISFFDSRGTFKVIAAANFGTVVVELMALVFFGLHYHDVFVITSAEDHLGYSFYMAVVATVILFLAFVASAIEASQTSKVLLNMQHRFTVWSTPYTLFIDQEQ
ncbi:uncharacterized protein LOC143276808 [Babylonia areolata]|uniref:uncharacterized protein LOC143276808 n=1 Tax=Babylonia areolata TaxID=304850 RepID=UPI003FD553F4